MISTAGSYQYAHLLALSSDVGSATMRREQLYWSSGTASRVFTCRQKLGDHHPAAPCLCGNQASGQFVSLLGHAYQRPQVAWISAKP